MKDDLISRQAAIDALHMHLMYRMGTDSNKKRLDDWINGVPSAQPAIEPRKIGHWNHNGYEWKATCSECGEPCATYSMGKPRDRYCKWCGAKMEEGENDALN